MEQSIQWNQAQQIVVEQAVNKQEKITEFLESSCELFDAADLQYYADETGHSIDWLLANGKNIDPTLSMALSMGVTIDEANLIL